MIELRSIKTETFLFTQSLTLAHSRLFMVSILAFIHLCALVFDHAHASVLSIYHEIYEHATSFFPLELRLNPETSEQSNVACDHSFVIINESSVEFLLWYVPAAYCSLQQII